MAERTRYPSDLADEQWELVQPALARNGVWGRPTEVDLRAVVNAIFYLVRTGVNGGSCRRTSRIRAGCGTTLINGARTGRGTR